MISAFYHNSADRLIYNGILYAFMLFLLLLSWQTEAYGRSALAPRHSGMEAPGEPRRLENMPGRSLGQNPDGGRGYIDAYGNRLENRPPAKAKGSGRPDSGASGPTAEKELNRPLPDPDAGSSSPLWKF